MTWNVENLFRAGTDSGPDTQAVYQAKLQGLADMINNQAPDALSVQEIGDPAALADLVALLNGTWHQHLSTHPDQRLEAVLHEAGPVHRALSNRRAVRADHQPIASMVQL